MNAGGSIASVLDSSMTSWRSLWANVFEIDKGTANQSGIVGRFEPMRNRRSVAAVKNPSPTTVPEVQIYGDTVAAQFSICNNVLYSIEGKRDNGVVVRAPRTRRNFNYGQPFNRTRNNYLVAYDLNHCLLYTSPSPRDS